MEDLLKKIWYNRNPTHETNSDTGEDMFWGTLKMVIDDYNSSQLEPPVILKIVGMIDEELKELSTPKSPFAQPFKEGRIMALQQLRKEIDNNFSK